MRFRAQVQHRNLVLLGFECRRLVRGPSMGPERLPFPALLRRLQQEPERRPHKGQALAQLSGRRLRRRSYQAISDQQ